MLLAFIEELCNELEALASGGLPLWGTWVSEETGAVILGVAACGVGVEATGIHGGVRVDIACAWES